MRLCNCFNTCRLQRMKTKLRYFNYSLCKSKCFCRRYFFSCSFEGIKKRSSFLNSSTDINCFFAKLMSTFLRHFLILQILQKKSKYRVDHLWCNTETNFSILLKSRIPLWMKCLSKCLHFQFFFSVFVKQNKTEINSFSSMYVDVVVNVSPKNTPI